jgi:DUF438 domain-containing protein
VRLGTGVSYQEIEMTGYELLAAFLDSLRQPFVFVDTEHIIRYMNKPAIDRYKGRPAEVGRSIFDCHNENSKRIILEVFEQLKQGEDERIITDNNEHRIFMRAVRDKAGKLIGYYERFEPPREPADPTAA